MRDLGEVLADLIDARARLAAVAAGDTAGRLELVAALERLREEAREVREADHPSEMARQWRAELAELRSRWERLASHRIDVVQQAGGGGQGGDFGLAADAARINRAMDAGGGRAAIEARIRELQGLLQAQED